MKAHTVLATLILSASTAAAFATPPPTGVLGKWREPSGSVIDVHPCGPDVCMTLIGVSKSPFPNDNRNPDETLRKRPLCGLEIGTGFHPRDADHAEGGKLYDPKSGKTYSGTLTANGDTLHLRGYVGISLFGRSQDWTRAPAGTESCKN